MTRRERKLVLAVCALALTAAVAPARAGAMHIAEGYLPAGWCVAWGLACLPVLALGVSRLGRLAERSRRALLVAAMAGAYTFVLSALKLPSVTGSSSHPTGTGLGAILLGAPVMVVLGGGVLLFQALLLAHGGLTTLGANIFSMSVAGPFVSVGVYRLSRRMGVGRKAGVFLAAALGDLATYCVTSVQLALAQGGQEGFTAALGKFLTAFAVTQLPLAAVEGCLTVAVVAALEGCARPELEELGYWKEVGA